MSQATGVDLLLRLKQLAGTAGPQLVLPSGNPVNALLRVVATDKARIDQHDVQLLTAWRNRYAGAFLSEFQATDEQTADWLANVVGPSDTKLLFMVDDLAHRTFAYMGIAFIDWKSSYGEADAIVRGEEAPAGTMTAALDTLLSWARTQLGLQHIGVRVRSDNTALAFYRKFGFEEVKRVPLRCTAEPGRTVWIEDPDTRSAKVSLVHMRLV